MKIRMYVKNVGDPADQAWDEEIDTETTGCIADAMPGMKPFDYAYLVVDYFNSTLKPGESVRELVSAEEIE